MKHSTTQLRLGIRRGAAEIVETHRYAEYDADRGYVVERWLERLPAEIKAQRPGLLLAQAWAAIQRFQIDRVTALIARVERLLDGQTGSPMLLGDLHYLRGNIQYWKGDGKESVASLEAALEQVAGWQHQIEYNTILMLTLARSMIGQQEQALQFLDTRIQEASAIEGQFVTHLMGGVAFLHLLAGDLAQTRQQAERLHAEANKRHFVNNDAWSSYLLGYVALQSYDLEQAVQHFAVASKERYTMQRGGGDRRIGWAGACPTASSARERSTGDDRAPAGVHAQHRRSTWSCAFPIHAGTARAPGRRHGCGNSLGLGSR